LTKSQSQLGMDLSPAARPGTHPTHHTLQGLRVYFGGTHIPLGERVLHKSTALSYSAVFPVSRAGRHLVGLQLTSLNEWMNA
jgi:hypothetical protein